MVTLEDFLIDVSADLIGFLVASVMVYLFFQRRERKSQQRLVQMVVSRLARAFTSFKANMIYNMQLDALEPFEAASFLMNAQSPALIEDMNKLQTELSRALQKRDVDAALQIRKRQWEIVLSQEFFGIVQRVVGQWSNKQWTKYFLFFETLLKEIKDLMDLYQSRLPSDMVRRLMEFETESETFRFYRDVIPEFFCRADELEIPLTTKLMANRKASQNVACESLLSISKSMTKLQEELEKS